MTKYKHNVVASNYAFLYESQFDGLVTFYDSYVGSFFHYSWFLTCI